MPQWGHGSLDCLTLEEGKKLRPGKLGVMVQALAFQTVSAAKGLSVFWDLAVFCSPEVPALTSYILGSQVCPGRSQSEGNAEGCGMGGAASIESPPLDYRVPQS